MRRSRGPNDLPQPQPPDSQAPTKPRSSESPKAVENRKDCGCGLQGAGWAVQRSHGLACSFHAHQPVTQPMAHMKVNHASASARTARLPRENDSVVRRDALPSASIINFCNLPAKTSANREQHECEGHALLVASQKSKESLHIQLY
jgi:hypothetical protein